MDRKEYLSLIEAALAEDLGEEGDVTSMALFSGTERSVFRLLSKSEGLLCGIEVFAAVFAELDGDIAVEPYKKDGEALGVGEVVARVRGPTKWILSGERTALNFLSHLSGIATRTRRLVEAGRAAGPGTPLVLDTRKTLPGMRVLQKYAVATGGACNHRMGLYDMVLLKDNHIDAAGGITAAIAAVRRAWGGRFKIEVEARRLEDVREALDAGVDRIMLDNMDVATMRRAAELVAGRVETEASGNLTRERLIGLAGSGITYASFGELTHTVEAFDFSLKQEGAL